MEIALQNDKFNRFSTFLDPPSIGFMTKMVNELKYVKVHEDKINTNNEGDLEVCDELFRLFNSDKNPLLNKQNFIRENKTHVSMSVGDIIFIDDDYYICRTMGFTMLQNINL